MHEILSLWVNYLLFTTKYFMHAKKCERLWGVCVAFWLIDPKSARSTPTNAIDLEPRQSQTYLRYLNFLCCNATLISPSLSYPQTQTHPYAQTYSLFFARFSMAKAAHVMWFFVCEKVFYSSKCNSLSAIHSLVIVVKNSCSPILSWSTENRCFFKLSPCVCRQSDNILIFS